MHGDSTSVSKGQGHPHSWEARQALRKKTLIEIQFLEWHLYRAEPKQSGEKNDFKC